MRSGQVKTPAAVALLTALALAVHGYHLGVEDQAIYLPAVEKALAPALFPHDADFFLAQTRPTIFPQFCALMTRALHLRLDIVVFLLQFVFLFLLLWAALRIARQCFASAQAQWAAVTMVTVTLALPIGGTALTLADNYLHPRLIATFFLLLMLSDVLERKWLRAILWLVLAAAFHIQMAFYGALLALFFVVPERWMFGSADSGAPQFALLAGLPLGSMFEPASNAWLEAARTRYHYHYLVHWEWYEWLGVVAPLAILWFYRRVTERKDLLRVRDLSGRLVAFGIFILLTAIVLTVPPQFERLTPYQPMRGFHLLYFFFLLFTGGLLGEFCLRRKALLWLVVFVPICAGMFFLERNEFPASAHIEWPGAPTNNPWLQAFAWIKANTPQNAYFALDPMYNDRPFEDVHGFRAFAERSMMADYVKDSGVALLFPAIAPRWQREVHARDGWWLFTPADFKGLNRQFGVDWVVVEQSHPSAGALDCPYQNQLVRVCHVR